MTSILRLSAFALCFVLISCDDPTKKIKNPNPESKEKVQKKPEPKKQDNKALSLDDIDGDKLPEFSFDKESHDFGTINQGDVPETTFKFKNTGDAPLIITSAKGSCGCTVPQWPREPLAPGEEGEIKVTFNSAGRSGRNSKTVTLLANTVPNTKVLTITSDIVVP